MLCPYCNKHIHFRAVSLMSIETDEDESLGVGFYPGFCPACGNIILVYQEGTFISGERGVDEPTVSKIIYPTEQITKSLSSDVPTKYRDDYEEAANVLPLSPKSSAALSRRCLQNFLQNHLKIKKKNLALEIQEFVGKQQVPSIISDSLDAIRNIGNFAAHPLKETNTGEIVDVEPGEAEWLLEVLDLLFDFYFVQPKKLEKRKAGLNDKLKNLGKQPLK